MTERMRQGLGLLVVAALALVLGIVLSAGVPALGTIGYVVALVCGVVGAVFVAVDLLRPTRSE